MPNLIQDKIDTLAAEIRFSGAVHMTQQNKQVISAAYGYSNRNEGVSTKVDSLFGIASGCKLFTAIAVMQLVEQGNFSLESKIANLLKDEFPLFSPEVTVHHLLTHSSGIADYFDEEIMEDFEELWKTKPMYTLRRLEDFVPMFRELPMKFAPGQRFHYNNAGYIVLGLLVERFGEMEFAQYIEQHIFKPCGMNRSGYFEMDALPANTALGYIVEKEGTYRTNIYSLPVKGGSDGGAFVTAPEMLLLWQGLFSHILLSPAFTALLLTAHIHEDGEEYYGYGVWITKRNDEVFKYHLMGYDPGVSFHSAVYPSSGAAVAVMCNESKGAYQILQAIEEYVK